MGDKLKLFISLPMKDRSDTEITNEISRIKNNFDNVKLLDSIFNLPEGKNTPVHYLAKSIELLADADVVYFAKGWNSARGCKIEHEIAANYNKNIIYEN